MYEKQRSFMDVQDLIFDGQISTATPTSFVDTISMAFTPTTLASFEADLSDAIIAAQTVPASVLVSEASGNHFWPGTSDILCGQVDEITYGNDDDDDDDDDDDESSMDSNYNYPQVLTKNNNNSGKGSTLPKTAGSAHQAKGVCAVKPVEQKQRKLPGPRPSRPIEEMTPLEAERRRRRRERNKNAAAKCRQRRVEQTTELLAETEKLEQESHRLEREIENLRRVKNQLEFVLESHKPVCTAVPPVTMDDAIVQHPMTSSVSNVSNVVRPNNLPVLSFSAASRGSTLTSTSDILEGTIFSFDTPTTLAGLTPLLSDAVLNSPSSFMLFSP